MLSSVTTLNFSSVDSFLGAVEGSMSVLLLVHPVDIHPLAPGKFCIINSSRGSELRVLFLCHPAVKVVDILVAILLALAQVVDLNVGFKAPEDSLAFTTRKLAQNKTY